MKYLIKSIIAIVFLSIPTFVKADLSCSDFEYAELQDMSQEIFIEEYCKVRESLVINAEMIVLTGSQLTPNFNSCKKTFDKMQRAYLKRFPDESIENLNDKCPKLNIE